MLKRKIEIRLKEWRKDSDRKPLVVKGVRQCGKTYIVQKFAEENYEHVAYLNFVKNPELATAFEGSLDVDDIIVTLSTMIRDTEFVAGKTCFIFDEIQECPQARTSLKFFKIDGRFDVICTGSLLGVKGYGKRKDGGGKEQPRSVPVGYETIVEMFPLDFEEFLWANGIKSLVTDRLQQCLDALTPVPEGIHKKMRDLFLAYVVVGGMPEVVNTFLATNNMAKVKELQSAIIDEYEDDMVKYADDADKPHIRQCFESIPKQLSKENKKFQYSVIKRGAKASTYEGSLQWIEDAGIVRRCYNLDIPELPLSGNAIDNCFKLYMADTGLFISMLDDGTQLDVLQGRLNGYKGAIFENVIADVFGKMQRKLYYFHKDSGLEIDFVTRYNGECTLIEVKASTGNTKSASTILKHPEKYHVYRCIKLGDYNIGVSASNGMITTLPLYMSFLLKGV